jgi:hypothetical protein
MPSKKPSPATSPLAPVADAMVTVKPSTRPPARQGVSTSPPNARQQPDNRWQRTKRYGWDSR